MATATIYPTTGINYIRTAETWSSARVGDGTPSLQVQNGDKTIARTLLSATAPPIPIYTFFRSYFDFDLSSIPSTAVIQTMSLHLYNIGVGSFTENVWLGYGGEHPLEGINEEYNYVYNYLTKGAELGLISNWTANTFSSSSLDIVDYPPTLIDDGKNPPYWAYYTIGCVSDADWTNNVDSTSPEVRIYGATPGMTGTKQPYLTVTYTAGYSNTVIGVPGANISTVSGVPSANISKVMGV